MELFHNLETLNKLGHTVAYHYEQLAPLRDLREQLLLVSAGTGYEHNKEKDGVYQDILNLMKQAAESVTLSMAANRPKFLVVARTVERQAFAEHFEQALNTYTERMHLDKTLQDCVRDAFYLLGIAKVCFGTSASVLAESDEWMAPGEPFCSSVSFNHFCYDTEATEFRHCAFMADRYRVRFDDLINDERFDPAVRNELRSAGPQSLNGSRETEYGDSLNSGSEPSSQFEEFVFLTDVFLPKDGVIYTYPCDEGFHFRSEKPLYSQEWEGRESGPYHFLNFGPVPDKTTPSSPAQNLLLLHHLINSLYRKLRDQAVRQKQVGVGRKGSQDDVDTMKEAEDGDTVLLNSPETFRIENYDGPNQQNFSFALNAMSLFSERAGNMDHKLGLSQSAETASQESMIGANVSRVEGAYQQQFVDFTRDIGSELGRLLYEDEVTEVPMTRSVPGTEISFDDPWRGKVAEGSREGDYVDYGVDIDPFSTVYRTPEERLQQIDGTVDRLIPILPLLQQQGGMFDAREYLRLRAKYTDIPELESIFKFQQPVEQEQSAGGSHERTLSPNTTRQYEHHNISSGSGQGELNNSLIQMMGSESSQQPVAG